MYKIGIAEEKNGTRVPKGMIEVPNVPAIGDQFQVQNVVAGRPVKVYAEVVRVLVQPSEAPEDAIVVVKTSLPELTPPGRS